MTFLVTSDSNFSLGENEDSPTNIVKAILTFTRGQRHKIHTKLAQMTIHALVKVHSTKLSSLEVKYLNKIQWLREKLRPKKKKIMEALKCKSGGGTFIPAGVRMGMLGFPPLSAFLLYSKQLLP
jgi:hypothetical protein